MAPNHPRAGAIQPGRGFVAQRAQRGWAPVAQAPVARLADIQAEQARAAPAVHAPAVHAPVPALPPPAPAGPRRLVGAADEAAEREMERAYAEYVRNPDLGVRYYQVDSDAGRDHAYDRHTYEGIFRAGRILTTHPTHVAIFATQQAFQAALAAMPTREDAWHAAGQAGRYDADLGSVHYQGTLLGDTMSLNSCYPTNRNYARNRVRHALEDPVDEDEFKARLP